MTGAANPPRTELRAQAVSMAAAVAPFGLAFGLLCSEADLSILESSAYSALVFTGGSQFAAVGVLRDGGTPAAAASAGMLIGLRLLAFGVVMAPALRGPVLKRIAMSHLMIDESMAVGSASDDLDDRRFGYLWGGLSIFVVWNLTTFVGRSFLGSNPTVAVDLGLDATVPAAFLALLWPRLSTGEHRRVAICGGLIAAITVPLAPPGIPIVVAVLGVLAAKRPQEPPVD